MAALYSTLLIFLILITTTTTTRAAYWCVARSDASTQALQTALDYACSTGADCLPLQSNGLCFLPNTIQAHASYAFNSFFQRKSMAPGSCDFAGSATIAQTDPSYGSCMYPSSTSTAGGVATPTTTSTNPNAPTMPTTTTPVYGNGDGGAGGFTPVMNPTTTPDNSKASVDFTNPSTLLTVFFSIIISFTL